MIDDLRFQNFASFSKDSSLLPRRSRSNSVANNKYDAPYKSQFNSTSSLTIYPFHRKKSQSSDNLSSLTTTNNYKSFLTSINDFGSLNLVKTTTTPIVDPYLSITIDSEKPLLNNDYEVKDCSGITRRPSDELLINSSANDENNLQKDKLSAISYEDFLSSWNCKYENLTKKVSRIITHSQRQL